MCPFSVREASQKYHIALLLVAIDPILIRWPTLAGRKTEKLPFSTYTSKENEGFVREEGRTRGYWDRQPTSSTVRGTQKSVFLPNNTTLSNISSVWLHQHNEAFWSLNIILIKQYLIMWHILFLLKLSLIKSVLNRFPDTKFKNVHFSHDQNGSLVQYLYD